MAEQEQKPAKLFVCAHCGKVVFEASPNLWRDDDGFTVCWAISSRPHELTASGGEIFRHEPVEIVPRTAPA